MTARFLTNQPALKAALLVAAGIATAHLSAIPFQTAFLLTAIAVASSVILLFFRGDALLKVAVPASLVFLGGLRYAQITQRFPDTHIVRHVLSGGTVTLEGFLIQDPVERPGRVELTVMAETLLEDPALIPVTGKLRTSYYGALPESLLYGDGIRLEGTLVRPRGRRNPGGFDYRAYLARRGVHALLISGRGSRIEKTGSGGGSVLLREVVYPLRRHILRTVDENTVGDARAILRALLVGERGTLEPELRDRFARAGIVHVLAVSGLHVGFVLLLLTVFLDFLHLPYAARTFLTILGLALYALLTEGRPPVIRASIMASTYLIGMALEKRNHPFNLVGAAALILLLWKPQDLFDIGFQLSFSAILSILFFYRKLMDLPVLRAASRKLSGYSLGRHLLPLLLVSVSAQLGTIPLSAVYFNRIPLLSAPVNLLVIPAAGIIVALGFVTILAGLLHPWPASVYGALNREILTLLMKLVSWIGDRPFAFIHAPSPDLLQILLYFVLVLALLDIHRPVLRKRYAFLLLVLLNVLAWRAVIRNESGRLTWVQLDVGQGDAAVLHLPRNRHILIDGGDRTPFFDNGERVVAPYLRRKGIRSLDAVLLTHSHNDHAGGLLYILDRFPVGRFLAAGSLSDTRQMRELQRILANRGIPAETITPPDTLEFPGIRLSFFSPAGSPGPGSTPPDPNDRSLVFRLAFGSTRWMFTGDAGLEIEREILRRNLPLASQVLKIGHHGSATATGLPFLAAVRPQVGVLSVGERNRFGHPSASVLRRLESLGIEILRTDRDGAVVIRSDGSTVERVGWH